MFDWIDIVNNSLRRLVTTLEPGELSGDQAAALVRDLAEVERLAAAGKALAAARVEESNRWRRDGHRSAAHWMAAQTGTSVRSASEAIDTAKRVTKLPQVDEAFRSGQLSASQAGEISAAAAVSPRSEHELLDAAKTETLSGLRERCRRTRHAALPDEAARNEAIRRSRYFRHRTAADGAFETSTRGLPVDGARLLAALEPFQKQVFDAARRAGTREPYEAYAYDALMLMAESRTAPCGPADGPTPEAAATCTSGQPADQACHPGVSGRPGPPGSPAGGRACSAPTPSSPGQSGLDQTATPSRPGEPGRPGSPGSTAGGHGSSAPTGSSPGQPGQPDHLGAPDRPDHLGVLERPDHLGVLERPDHLGVLERPDHLGAPDRPVSPEQSGTPDRLGMPDRPELIVMPMQSGPPDGPGRSDEPGLLGSSGRLARSDGDGPPDLVDPVDRRPDRADPPCPSPVVGPKAMIHVRVDLSALRRGHTVDGEICEIPGVGPIPVATARMLAADSIINVLLVDGVDVTRIAHTGRTVTAHQRSALRERSSTCEVPGCDARNNLEIDHDDPWALSKNTSLDNLNLLCRWHHYQKTHCGYRLTGSPGQRRWNPPRGAD